MSNAGRDFIHLTPKWISARYTTVPASGYRKLHCDANDVFAEPAVSVLSQRRNPTWRSTTASGFHISTSTAPTSWTCLSHASLILPQKAEGVVSSSAPGSEPLPHPDTS